MVTETARRVPGRHFLQIPGPTNLPDRVLRAIDAATIDHRGPAFAELGRAVLDGLRDYRHDESGVDVSVVGAQKGLMLPPGLSFNAIGARGDLQLIGTLGVQAAMAWLTAPPTPEGDSP
jgi:aspartate aminotransferase-like enzyme